MPRVAIVISGLVFALMGNALWAEPKLGTERLVSDVRMEQLKDQTIQHSDDELLELALGYEECGEISKAKPLYAEVAARGVAVAEFRLGWLCESGRDGEQSYKKARAHYERAVEGGVAEAHMRLGLLYLEGWGTPREVLTAIGHIRIAAEADYPPAQRIVAMMYFTGTGVVANLPQACEWAEKAARRDADEERSLAKDIRKKAARLAADVQSARQWYQLSVEAGYNTGMRTMASTFLERDVSDEKFNFGKRWLELGKDNEDGLSCHFLAGLYLWSPRYQEAGEKEKWRNAARDLLTRAAQLDDMESREILELEKDGKDLAEAYRYVDSEPVERRYVKRMADLGAKYEADPNGDSPPRPLKAVQPIYPTALKKANIEGSVQLEFIVDQTGRVVEPRAVSATHPGFSENAVAAISVWRFRPGFKAGTPVNTKASIVLKFTLGGVLSTTGDKFKDAMRKNAEAGKTPPTSP